MVEVYNLEKHRGLILQEGDFRCDRPSKWGNPFIMYQERLRNEVCDRFQIYFRIMETGKTRSRDDIINALVKEAGMARRGARIWYERTGGFLDITELKDAKRLFCWCHQPGENRRCHCDYLKQRIEALIQREKQSSVSETFAKRIVASDDDVDLWGGGK
jgi:Domain of unknown function (DUF4326)